MLNSPPLIFGFCTCLSAVALAQSGLPTQAEPTAAPYPPSHSIRSLSWMWESRQTAALGSDLWPVTWGPDNHLYAAWGDGGGFGGSDTDGRVAMGIARIEDNPPGWRGVNVNGGKNPEHPASFAKKGKTGALLFVDNVLYSMVNLQDGAWPDVTHVLAWSTDKGATWEQASWVFPKGAGNFQPAKFLNSGPNYSELPYHFGRYVYIYGPRQSTGRGSGNELYLARVPRHKIRDQFAYEFFAGLGRSEKPKWSQNSSLAEPVFTDQNGVTPGAVVYDPGLRRFLLTCFHTGPGQLGVCDGPAPWGPWTTVSYEEQWGNMGTAGEGLSCEFPQKWMSPDGLNLWCVFSVYGDGGKLGIDAHDKFNIVKVRLELFSNGK